MDTTGFDYSRAAGYWGRNRYCTAIGLELNNYPDVKWIGIQPINSKGHIGNCEIQIPYEDIPELIKILQAMYDENVDTQLIIESKIKKYGEKTS